MYIKRIDFLRGKSEFDLTFLHLLRNFGLTFV
nr:MAG TPA: hypothetical protein [Caudoviricetes sp.]